MNVQGYEQDALRKKQQVVALIQVRFLRHTRLLLHAADLLLFSLQDRIKIASSILSSIASYRGGKSDERQPTPH